MKFLPVLFICAVLAFNSSWAQSTELYLSEEEIQAVIGSPKRVDAKIDQLTELAGNPISLQKEVSILQTILLLEPYSDNAQCSLGITYSRITELLMRIGVSDDALRFIHKGLRHEGDCDNYNAVRVYNLIGKLGSFHLISGNLDSAMHYFHKAELYSDTMEDPLWHSAAMNNLGMAYTERGLNDSAYAFYNNAIFELNDGNPKHQHLLGSITDNLAQWHESEGDYDIALQRFQENVDRYQGFQDTFHIVKSVLGVARTEMKLDHVDSAKQTLSRAFEYLNVFKQHSEKRAQQMVDYYKLKVRLYDLQSDLEKAVQFSDSVQVWQERSYEENRDALQAMISTLNRTELSRVYRDQSLRRDLMHAKEKAHNRLLWLIGMSILAAVLLVALVISKMRGDKS